MLLHGLVLAATVVLGGCPAAQCPDGTEKKVDDATGAVVCISPKTVSSSVPCDVDAGAQVVGGVCIGDPKKFPSCGPGTRLDTASNQCVPDLPDGGVGDGGNVLACVAVPPCGPSDVDGDHFCVNGVVRYLKDDTCSAGKTFEVRAYDPIEFLFSPDPSQVMPQKVVMTDTNGAYKLSLLADTSNQKLIAIAVIDPGTNHQFVLAGAGAAGVVGGGTYRVDVFAVEASLVGTWDVAANLSGNDTFEKNGAYVGRFYTDATEKSPAPGVKLRFRNSDAASAYYFKGNLQTIDVAQAMTDATGTIVQKVVPSDLGNYSGSGGGVTTWETWPGASVPGVVFVQKFHPKM